MTGKIIALASFILALLCTGCIRKPSADFIIDKTQYVPGETMYTANRSLHAKSYKWTFPDGTTATSIDATYIIPGNTPDGTYSVKLEAFSKNGNKSAAIVKPVDIKTPASEVTFWCGSAQQGTVSVEIDGIEEGTITARYANNPGCGASGCVIKKLEFGVHSISATSNGFTWYNYLQITKTSCTTFKLQ